VTGDAELANARAFWLGYGIEYRDDAAVALYRSGVRSPSLNGILRVSDDDVDGVLKQAQRRLDGVPWMWWAGPDSPPGTAERLLAHGAAEVGRQSIMAAPTDRLCAPESAPAGLTVRQVSGAAMLREWARTLAPVFGIQAGQLKARTNLEFQRTGDVTRFAGSVDGRIVATVSLFLEQGVAGFYSLATTPEFRRRGVGAAMMGAALRAAREWSVGLATLQATAQGEPLYTRMGFERVGEYRLFTLPVVS